MRQTDVLSWFIERSLLALPNSIRHVFWFNSASLSIVYRQIEIGIELFQKFAEEYASNEDRLIQAMVKTANMLAKDNEDNPNEPAYSFLVLPNVVLDLPPEIPQPTHAIHVDLDVEFDARVQDWN